MQQLPDELLALIVRFVPLCELAGPLRASRAWARQARDDLWSEIARRQWGARCGLRGLRGLCADRGPAIAGALDDLPAAAQRFVRGIARGYCPTDDGVFTHHAPGATPAHYRHDASTRHARHADHRRFDGAGGARAGEPPPPRAADEPECRGRWEWSPDRVHWFDAAEPRVTRGPFRLYGLLDAPENERIRAFLDAHPIVPLCPEFVARAAREAPPPPPDAPATRRRHESLGMLALRDLIDALMRPKDGFVDDGRRPPASACDTARVYTVHRYFRPPLHVACQDEPPHFDAWAGGVSRAAAVPDVCTRPGPDASEVDAVWLAEQLNRAEFVEPAPLWDDFAAPTAWPLGLFICSHEARLRAALEDFR